MNKGLGTRPSLRRVSVVLLLGSALCWSRSTRAGPYAGGHVKVKLDFSITVGPTITTAAVGGYFAATFRPPMRTASHTSFCNGARASDGTPSSSRTCSRTRCTDHSAPSLSR